MASELKCKDPSVRQRRNTFATGASTQALTLLADRLVTLKGINCSGRHQGFRKGLRKRREKSLGHPIDFQNRDEPADVVSYLSNLYLNLPYRCFSLFPILRLNMP